MVTFYFECALPFASDWTPVLYMAAQPPVFVVDFYGHRLAMYGANKLVNFLMRSGKVDQSNKKEFPGA